MQKFVIAALVASIQVNGMFFQENKPTSSDDFVTNKKLDSARPQADDRYRASELYDLVIRNPALEYYRYVPYEELYPMHHFSSHEEEEDGLGSMAGKVGGAVMKGSKATLGAAGKVGAVAGKVGMVAGKLGAEKIHATLKGVADVGKIAADLAKGKPPTFAQATALLKTIPGMEDIADIVEMGGKVAKAGGQAMGMIEKVTAPDDGKPKSCWVKSHGRGFGVPSMGKPCKAGRESSGGFCYDVCKEGKGVGPVCWGSCPTGTHSCGVLCMLDGTTCVDVAKKITQDAIATGVKGAGSDYFGAIKGALQLAGNFAYPVCATMNEIDPEFWQEDYHRYYDDQYYLQ